MTILTLFSIIFILLYACNLTCSILRYDKTLAAFINVPELLIPVVGLIMGGLLLFSQFTDNVTLYIASYSMHFLTFPSIIPFAFLKHRCSKVKNVQITTFVILGVSILGLILSLILSYFI